MARIRGAAGGGAHMESSAAEKPTGGGLEKIIRDIDRPALLVTNDSFPPSALPTWRAYLENARPSLERAVRGVGRVDIEAYNRRHFLGTAWVVAPSIVVTNRHVATLFARYAPDGTFPIRKDALGKPVRVLVDFKKEHQSLAVHSFQVKEVLHMEPDDGVSPDLAVLRIDDKSDQGLPPPEPLPLSNLDVQDDQLVACIGYPGEDPDEPNAEALDRYFNRIYHVKRLSPGLARTDGIEWRFRHDCTTLSGSSGSAVVDLIDGAAIGLHFSGASGVTNYAVRASTVLARLGKLGITPAALPEARPAPPPQGDSASDEAGGGIHKASYFNGRDGYVATFLGTEVGLPRPASQRANEIATFTEADGSPADELRYTHFSVIQNGERRLPWITGVNIDGKHLRRPPRATAWYRDGRLPPEAQAGNEIYTGSGFSRGHMVRRLDPCWGSTDDEIELANKDTFHFTNACPQEQNQFNDKLWGDLEDYILDNADSDDIRVSVFTGPIFGDDDPLVDDLPIPLSFWKVVAWRSRGKLKTVGFILSQEPFLDIEFAGGLYRTSERPLTSIARQAGIEFDAATLAADVHAGEEARPRAMRSLDELTRHF
ncbi:MAG TPA: DNA/RNA non-specific endonuclease [Polyangiaceae bacterium]|nr:DNA/RNA non-specific endonuclease [Polyangiaceae bacterium]